MFKAERLEKIKTLVLDRKQVDVSSLSKLLNVTEVTIRSDLEQLEQAGFLKRLHGGAILNEEIADKQENDDSLCEKMFSYDKNKERVARIAAAQIQENDHIFLGGGETCYYIARELTHFKRLTILTNNLHIAYAISPHMNIHLTLTGGQMLPGRFCMAGDMFHKIIENLYVNKSFFSVAGVDLVAGYTLESTQEITVFREMVARSRQVNLVVDHTKFDRISFAKLDDLTLCDRVISDEKIPSEYAEYYREHGISLIHSTK